MDFKSSSIILWHLRIRWLNCMELTKNMQFYISHNFRVDNHYTDKIASIGLQQNDLIWMVSTPLCILDSLNYNILGFTKFILIDVDICQGFFFCCYLLCTLFLLSRFIPLDFSDKVFIKFYPLIIMVWIFV